MIKTIVVCPICQSGYNPAKPHTCLKKGSPFEWQKHTRDPSKCKTCGARLEKVQDWGGTCWSCKDAEKKEKKRKWLVDRKYLMTLEDRLEELESWMYDSKNKTSGNIFDTVFR